MHGSHGLSALRERRTKSRDPKGLQLEVGTRRAPCPLVCIKLCIVIWQILMLPLTFSWEVSSCSRRRWGVAFHKSNLGQNQHQQGPCQGQQAPEGLHGPTAEGKTPSYVSVHVLSQAAQYNQNRRHFSSTGHPDTLLQLLAACCSVPMHCNVS